MSVSAVSSFVKVSVFAKVLGAADFSYYAFLEIVLAYGQYAGTCGLLEGLNRQLPIYLSKAKDESAKKLAGEAAGIIGILSISAFTLYSAIVSFLLNDNAKFTESLILCGAIAIINNFFLLYNLVLVAHQRTTLFAGIMACKNILTVSAGVLLASTFGLWGIFCAEAMVILTLTLIIIFASKQIKYIRFSFHKKLLNTFKVGFPMMLGSLTTSIGRNLDRVTVAYSLGAIIFGQYSFAMIPVSGGIICSNILIQYLTPRVCFAIGKGSSLLSQRKRIDRVVLALLIGSVAFYPFFYFLTIELQKTIFSDFQLGLQLMRILYFGGMLQIFVVYQSLLVAANEGGMIFRQSVYVVTFSAALCALGFKLSASPYIFAAIFVLTRLQASWLVVKATWKLSATV